MSKTPQYKIKNAAPDDLEKIVNLIVRLKRLNSEFDPLFGVNEDLSQRAKKYLEEGLKNPETIILVAEQKGKIIGIVKADIKDRVFYEPRMEGLISEFYVLPEFRRTDVGTQLLEEAVKHLKAKGAQIIAAEFPSQNRIAGSFYEKQGFRAIFSIFAKIH